MAGRISTAASRLLGDGQSVAFSLPTRSGMGLPVGKHIVPDKPLQEQDELLWDKGTPFPEPCIDHLVPSIGKHIEESNLEDCIPSIVQNGAGKSSMMLRPHNKKLKTNVENLASTDQIAKNIISEMDDDYGGDIYNEDDVPKEKERKIPRKSSSRNMNSEVLGSTANDTPKRRLQHGSSRCKSARRQVKEILLKIPDDELDRKKLVIKDLIMRASFKELKFKKEAATLKNSFDNNCVEHEQDSNGDDRNVDIQQEGRRFNYHSYMKRTHQTRWSKTDTEFFYQAIRQFGTDFAMIQVLFPNRSRQQVKAKFKNEQRKHPLQIADAFVHRSKDHSHFEKFIQHLKTVAEQKSKNTASDSSAQSQDEEDQNEAPKVQPYDNLIVELGGEP